MFAFVGEETGGRAGKGRTRGGEGVYVAWREGVCVGRIRKAVNDNNSDIGDVSMREFSYVYIYIC